jgi:hypothetical protein
MNDFMKCVTVENRQKNTPHDLCKMTDPPGRNNLNTHDSLANVLADPAVQTNHCAQETDKQPTVVSC